MPRSFLRRCVPALLATALAGAPAWADVITPDRAACNSKAAGTACEVEGKTGSCQTSTCSRLDYSKGTPPTTVDEPCQVCVPGPTKSTDKAGAKDKGCAVSGEQSAAGSLLLGLALLVVARRRRR